VNNIWYIRTHLRLSRDFAVFLSQTWQRTLERTCERKLFCTSVAVSKQFRQSTFLTKFPTDGQGKLKVLVFFHYPKITRKKCKPNKNYYKNWYTYSSISLVSLSILCYTIRITFRHRITNIFNLKYDPIINAFNTVEFGVEVTGRMSSNTVIFSNIIKPKNSQNSLEIL